MFLQTACLAAQDSHSLEELTGTYQSPNYSIFDKVYYNLLQRTSFAVGTTLELKEDSSFHLTTCGNIITGNWSVNADTLLLHATTNRWRNDSLQQHGFNGEWPRLGSQPEKYLIDGKMLRQRYRIEDRVIFDLEKVGTNRE